MTCSVYWSRVAGSGMKYLDCAGRSELSGNRVEQPGISSSTSLVPSPAVITRASDSTVPVSVRTCQEPPSRTMPRIRAPSVTVTPRAGSAAVSSRVTAATSANPASTSSQPPSAANCGKRRASSGPLSCSRRSWSSSSTAKLRAA